MHRYFDFAIATSQLFQHPENVKISTFPITLSQQKCYVFKSIWRILKNFYFGWKIRNVAILVENLKVHRHYSFAIATLQLFQHPEHVKFQLFPLHCPSGSPISSKAFNEFSKTFFYLKDKESRYSGWKFEMDRNFSFAIATFQLFQDQNM